MQAIIKNGQTESLPIDCTTQVPVAIFIPRGFSGKVISITSSDSFNGTYSAILKNNRAISYRVENDNTFIFPYPSVFVGKRFIKIVSDVAQSAEISLDIVDNPINNYIVTKQNGTGASGSLKVALIGSSLTQHNTTANLNNNRLYHESRGWFCWFAAFLGQPFDYDVWIDRNDKNGRDFSGANFGVSGQFSDTINTRIDDVIASNPDVVIIQSGTNNVTFDTAYDDTVDSINRLVSAGILVLYFPITPRLTSAPVGGDSTDASWAAGSESRLNAQNLNSKMKDFCRRTKGVIYLDVNKYLINQDSNDGVPFTNVLDDLWDAVHFSNHGAFLIAKAMFEQVGNLFPLSSPSYINSPEDIYNENHNQFGNLLVNPAISTVSTTNHPTAGTVGTGVTAATGTAATSVGRNITVERSSGASTGAARIIARKLGLGNWQELEVTAAGATGESVFYIRTNGATIAHTLPAGTWVQCGFDVEMDAFGTDAQFSGFKNISPYLDMRDGSSSLTVCYGLAPYQSPLPAESSKSASYRLPNQAWAGTLITPAFPLPVGCVNFRFRAEIIVDDNTSGSTGKVRIGSLFLRPVPDPRANWNF